MYLEDIKEKIESLEEEILENTEELDAGVMSHIYHNLFITVYLSKERDFVAVNQGSVREFEYYGGFEYADPDCKTYIGNLVLYSAEEERVTELIERIEGI